jgi:hypothetical protein
MKSLIIAVILTTVFATSFAGAQTTNVSQSVTPTVCLKAGITPLVYGSWPKDEVKTALGAMYIAHDPKGEHIVTIREARPVFNKEGVQIGALNDYSFDEGDKECNLRVFTSMSTK